MSNGTDAAVRHLTNLLADLVTAKETLEAQHRHTGQRIGHIQHTIHGIELALNGYEFIRTGTEAMNADQTDLE